MGNFKECMDVKQNGQKKNSKDFVINEFRVMLSVKNGKLLKRFENDLSK